MPIDPRFYASQGAVTLGNIAELAGAELRGDPTIAVTGVSSSSSAIAGDICFFEGKPAALATLSADAAGCFIRSDLADQMPHNIAALVCAAPRLAHAKMAVEQFKLRDVAGQDTPISPGADIHPEAKLAPGVVVGDGAAIGAGTRIGPGVYVGPGVQIGRDCRIGAQASLICALVGNNVKLSSGVRIGEAGFGVFAGDAGPEDQPHFGRVILQDHVTIGSNSAVDRGAFDDTILGEHTKIDNICHIAHNVIMGRGVIMAGFSGISGSCNIGDGVRLGGRSGIADHVTVGAGASLSAGGGAFRDIPAGEVWGGTPARPIRTYMREVAWLSKNAHGRKANK